MSKEIDKRVIDKSFHEGYEVDTVTIQESDYEYLKQQNKRYQKILTLLNDKEKLATEIYKENENLVMFTPEQVIDSILRKIDRLESDEG